jgi:hypothetical protein
MGAQVSKSEMWLNMLVWSIVIFVVLVIFVFWSFVIFVLFVILFLWSFVIFACWSFVFCFGIRMRLPEQM